jgi:hypothetical protein
MKAYEHPRAEGTKLEREFIIPKEGPWPIKAYIAVWARGLVSRNDKTYKKGHWRSKLLLNDKSICVLNEVIPVPEEGPKVQMILIEMKGKDFSRETNKLVIKAGAKGRNADDFEVWQIVIGVSKTMISKYAKKHKLPH